MTIYGYNGEYYKDTWHFGKTKGEFSSSNSANGNGTNMPAIDIIDLNTTGKTTIDAPKTT